VSGLREQQEKEASRSQADLRRARNEAEREREVAVAAVHGSLTTVTRDLDRWQQAAGGYEREAESLRGELQQQSLQWQKAADIQGNA